MLAIVRAVIDASVRMQYGMLVDKNPESLCGYG